MAHLAVDELLDQPVDFVHDVRHPDFGDHGVRGRVLFDTRFERVHVAAGQAVLGHHGDRYVVVHDPLHLGHQYGDGWPAVSCRGDRSRGAQSERRRPLQVRQETLSFGGAGFAHVFRHRHDSQRRSPVLRGRRVLVVLQRHRGVGQYKRSFVRDFGHSVKRPRNELQRKIE